MGSLSVDWEGPPEVRALNGARLIKNETNLFLKRPNLDFSKGGKPEIGINVI